jgi:predicted hydrolase (HD superfamily)
MESQITREAAWEPLRKYKSKGFAAGCSREVIEKGAEMLGWPLDEVLQKTLDAMRNCEAHVSDEMQGI